VAVHWLIRDPYRGEEKKGEKEKEALLSDAKKKNKLGCSRRSSIPPHSPS